MADRFKVLAKGRSRPEVTTDDRLQGVDVDEAFARQTCARHVTRQILHGANVLGSAPRPDVN